MEFISIKDAARILGISERHIYLLITKGKITKYKRLGKSLLNRQDVISLLEPKAIKESA